MRPLHCLRPRWQFQNHDRIQYHRLSNCTLLPGNVPPYLRMGYFDENEDRGPLVKFKTAAHDPV
jgi:hypothetical protein